MKETLVQIKDLYISEKVATKKDLLKDMVATLPYPEEKQEEILHFLMEREEVKSTAIGHSVAIPHAKAPIQEEILFRLFIHKKGVDFEAIDQKPVHLVFLILSRLNATVPHLKALAQVSHWIKNSSFREKLCQAKDVEEAFEIVKEQERIFEGPFKKKP